MTTKTRSAAILLLAIFAGWQVSAFAHFVAATHEVCEHGKIVDSDHHEHHGEGDSHHDHDSDHHDCAFISLLTSAQTRLGDESAPLVLDSVAVADLPAPLPLLEPYHQEELFTLAPSHSPPASS